jgi:nucleoside-diphosphate-sugar epimerase
MRVFVTGATGFIGSAVVAELLGAGHRVTGLARSDASVAALAEAGAQAHRGSLDDLDSLRAGAEAADGVIHLAYHHDFDHFHDGAEMDRRAINALGDALAGSGRPLVVAGGILWLSPGRTLTEDHPAPPDLPRFSEAAVLSQTERNVRTAVVRLPPSVHGEGDHGFVPTLVAVAREKGAAGYVGDGANRWPAVHRRDAARLFRLAVEQAKPGSILQAVADEGVPARSIADVIGRHLDMPTVSVDTDTAGEHFGWIGPLFAVDAPATSALTRDLLNWRPTHPNLLDDLESGHYFTGAVDTD